MDGGGAVSYIHPRVYQEVKRLSDIAEVWSSLSSKMHFLFLGNRNFGRVRLEKELTKVLNSRFIPTGLL